MIGRPGMLQSVESQRVERDQATGKNICITYPTQQYMHTFHQPNISKESVGKAHHSPFLHLPPVSLIPFIFSSQKASLVLYESCPVLSVEHTPSWVLIAECICSPGTILHYIKKKTKKSENVCQRTKSDRISSTVVVRLK